VKFINDVKEGVMERPFNAIVQLILTGVVAWVGLTIQSTERSVLIMNGDVRVLTTRLNSMETASREAAMAIAGVRVLEARLVSVEQGTDDRYRGQDAAKDFGRVNEILQRIANRQERMEELFDAMENRIDELDRRVSRESD